MISKQGFKIYVDLWQYCRKIIFITNSILRPFRFSRYRSSKFKLKQILIWTRLRKRGKTQALKYLLISSNLFQSKASQTLLQNSLPRFIKLLIVPRTTRTNSTITMGFLLMILTTQSSPNVTAKNLNV